MPPGEKSLIEIKEVQESPLPIPFSDAYKLFPRLGLAWLDRLGWGR
jgi:hypothetical protein